MSSTNENTFGARLRRAQDILNYIQGFTVYNPPRTQESVAELTTLINNIISTNGSESSVQQQFKSAVDLRQAAFKGTGSSVEKLLAPIKGAVESQFGKNSTESVAVTAIIKNMRSTKLVKPPVDPKLEKHSSNFFVG